jgi:hypothetical protein
MSSLLGARAWRARLHALVITVLTFGYLGGVATAPVAAQGENHCISPFGVDLNVRYGVSAAIVAPFCPEIGTGLAWSVTGLWTVNTTFAKVPRGFVSAGATPADDFRAKFLQVRYVVDAGTAQQKQYVFSNSSDLYVATIDGAVLINTVTLGTMNPLAVGPHVVDRYWSFSAMHCDGLGRKIDENCLPAGEFLDGSVVFEVTVR